jgi:hypothetical protein
MCEIGWLGEFQFYFCRSMNCMHGLINRNRISSAKKAEINKYQFPLFFG